MNEHKVFRKARLLFLLLLALFLLVQQPLLSAQNTALFWFPFNGTLREVISGSLQILDDYGDPPYMSGFSTVNANQGQFSVANFNDRTEIQGIIPASNTKFSLCAYFDAVSCSSSPFLDIGNVVTLARSSSVGMIMGSGSRTVPLYQNARGYMCVSMDYPTLYFSSDSTSNIISLQARGSLLSNFDISFSCNRMKIGNMFFFNRRITAAESSILFRGDLFCYNIAAKSAQVCSGNGACVLPDVCACKTGYSGPNCAVWSCNGIPYTSSAVCSGNGTCTSLNTCSCGSGYSGLNCEVPICSGKQATNPTVCSSVGTCVAPNTCTCQPGYSGTNCEMLSLPNAEYQIYSNLYTFTEAQTQCNSVGGALTSIQSAEENAALKSWLAQYSISTSWIGLTDSLVEGKYTWVDTYSFIYNSSLAAGSLSNHDCARIQASTGDWEMIDCGSKLPAICRRASCNGVRYYLPSACNSNGTCIGTNQCRCNEGYTGSNCEVPICYSIIATNSSVCNKRGTCVAKDKCVCSSCYVGNECEFDICSKYPITELSGRNVGVYGQNYNVQVQIMTTIPGYLQTQIQGFDAAYTLSKFVAVPLNTSNAVNPVFAVTVKPASIGYFKFGLAYKAADISQQPVQWDVVVTSSQVSFSAGVPIAAVLPVSQPKMTLQTNSLYIPDLLKVICSQTQNGVEIQNKPIHLSLSSLALFTCPTQYSNPGPMSLLLKYNASETITLGTGPLPLEVLDQGSISMSSNIAIGSALYTVALQSTYNPFQSRVRCLMEGVRDVAATVISSNLYLCPFSQSPGVNMLSLLLNDGVSNVRLSTNSIPIIFLEQSAIHAASPYAFMATQDTIITVTLKTPITANYSTASLQFRCVIGMVTANATQVASNQFSCTIPANSLTLGQHSLKLNAVSAQTNQVAAFSSNSATITAWMPLEIQQATPILVKYTDSTASDTLTIKTNDTLPVNSLFCATNNVQGAVVLSPAIRTESNVVSCSMTFRNLTEPAQELSVWLIASSNDTSYFTVSSPTMLAAFKTPLQFGSSVISPENYNSSIDLMFRVPTSVDYQFAVQLAPTYTDSGRPASTVLPCIFTPGQTPSCRHGDWLRDALQQSALPITLRYTLVVSRQNVSANVEIAQSYYYEAIPSVSELPFMLSIQTTAVQITLGRDLNPAFGYTCQFTIGEIIQTATAVLSPPSTVKCNLTPLVSSEGLQPWTVRVHVANPEIALSSSERVDAAQFALSPAVSEVSSTYNYSVSYLQGTSLIQYSPPSKYWGTEFTTSVSSFSKIQCIISNSTGEISCPRQSAWQETSEYHIKTSEVTVNISSAATSLSHPFITYSRSDVAGVYPQGCLRDQIFNITLTFHHTPLSIQPEISSMLQFHCSYKVNTYEMLTSQLGGQLFTTSRGSSTNSITCSSVPCSAIGSLLDLSLLMKVPSIHTEKLFTINSIQETQPAVQVLDKYSIGFLNESESSLLQLGKNYSFTIAMTNVNIPASLHRFLKCKLPLAEILVTTVIEWSNQSTIHLSCSVMGIMDEVSVQMLTVWYQEKAVEFPVSLNGIPFYFVKGYPVERVQPPAVRVNVTGSIELYTLFPLQVASTWEVSYTCFIRGYNQSIPATMNAELQFISCQINRQEIGRLEIDIILSMKGVDEVISSEPALLEIVDSFFLEPSHGSVGDTNFILNDYNGNSTEIQFRATTAFKFVCTLAHQSLNCSLPPVPGRTLTPFESYQLMLDNKFLAMHFIAFERRQWTSINPRVVPALHPFQLQYGVESITTPKGGLVINLGTRAYTVGNELSGFTTGAIDVPALSESVQELQLVYRNLMLLTYRYSVAITEKQLIYIVNPRSITLASPDVIIKGEPITFMVDISGPALPSYVAAGLRCYLNDSVILLATMLTGTRVSCSSSFALSTTGQFFVSVRYVAADAHNGSVDLSATKPSILAIERLVLEDVTPYLSLNSTSSPVLRTSLNTMSFPASVAAFLCSLRLSNDSGAAVSLFPAQVLGSNKIRCALTRPARHQQYILTLNVKSLITGFMEQISTNNLTYIFYDKLSFANASHPVYIQDSTVSSFSLDYSLKSKNVLFTPRDLFCQFRWLGSIVSVPVVLPDSTTITCTLPFTSTANHVDLSSVSVWYVTEDGDRLLVSEETTLMVVKSPLTTSLQVLVNEKDLGAPFSIDFAVAQRDYTFSVYSEVSTDLNSNFHSSVLSCSHPGVYFNCSLQVSDLQVVFPAYLRATVVITSAVFGQTYAVSSLPTVYYRTASLNKVYPNVIAAARSKVIPKQVVLDISSKINFDTFDIYCRIEGKKSKREATYIALKESANSTSTIASCKIETSGVEEVLTGEVGIIQRNNRGFAPISEQFKIYPVILPKWGPKFGPRTGDSTVNVELPSAVSLLKYELLFKSRRHTVRSPCIVADSVNITCTTVSFAQTIDSSSASVELWIENEYAVSLSPAFQIYDRPTISRVVPAPVIDVMHTEAIILEGNFPFFEKQQILVQYRNSATMQLKQCQFDAEGRRNRISCEFPDQLFNQDDLMTSSSNVSVSLSFNGENYDLFDNLMVFYNSSNVMIGSGQVGQTVFKVGTTQLFSLDHSLLPGGNLDVQVQLQLFDDSFQLTLYPLSVNPSGMLFQTPLLYDEPLTYPREFQTRISYDGGKSFSSLDMPLKFEGFEPLSMSFTSEQQGKFINGLSISGFPNITLKSYHSGIRFGLVSVDSPHVIELSCNSAHEQCISKVALPSAPHTFELKAEAFNDQAATVLTTIKANSLFTAHKRPIIRSIRPKILLRNTRTRVTIELDESTPVASSLWLALGSSEPTRRSTLEDKLPCFSQAITSTLVIADCTTTAENGTYSISTSLNGVNYYQEDDATESSSNSIQSLEAVKITAVANEDQEAVLYTFKTSPLTLYGEFSTLQAETAIVAFFFKNRELKFPAKELTAFSINAQKNSIQFESPLLASPEYQYPLSLDIGISIDNGFSFTKASMYLLDSYRQPIIFTVEPKVISLSVAMNLVLLGQYFTNLRSCEFSTGNMNVSVPVHVEQNVVYCQQPSKSQITETPPFLELRLRTNASLVSAPFKLWLYDTMIIKDIYPRQSPCQGGSLLTLFLDNVDESLPVFITYGSVEVPKPCVAKNSTAVECEIVPHEPETLTIKLSYNRKTWYPASTPFQYIGCDPGYTTQAVEIACSKCPPGTYKPTSGNYACVPCVNGTYSVEPASVQCSVCPQYSTSRPGASSSYECVCQPGYFVNPKPTDNSKLFCIPCLTGANCLGYNISIPESIEGYWHSQYAPFTYYECLPRAACVGGGFESCAPGYMGERCGICQDRYFKFRNQCMSCGEFPWERLIGLGVFAGFIALLLLLFTSVKFTHLGSLSIAVKLFQIIGLLSSYDIPWPYAFQSISAVSTATNFSFDFLSPQCLFTGISYITRFSLSISLPFVIFAAIVILYALGMIRSAIAHKIGKYVPFGYIGSFKHHPKPSFSLKESIFNTIQRQVILLVLIIPNTGIYLRNYVVALMKHGYTADEKRQFQNKLINAFITYLIVSYIQIINTCSEVFVCRLQPNGERTMNSSPDIKCFQSSSWWILFGITIFCLLIFVLGATIFFIFIFSRHHKLQNDKNYQQRFRFLIKRYKRRYFFYEGLVTLHKLTLSTLRLFFKPLIVIVFSILVQFVALAVHLQIAPYKKKMHNIMEYLVTISTLLTLFFGLLLSASSKIVDLPPVFNQILVILTMVVLVACIVLVVLMSVWDVQTRKKKDKIKGKRTHNTRIAPNSIYRLQNATFSFFADQESSDEDNSKNINDVIESLAGAKRIQRKASVLKRFSVKVKRQTTKKKLEPVKEVN